VPGDGVGDAAAQYGLSGGMEQGSVENFV